MTRTQSIRRLRPSVAARLYLVFVGILATCPALAEGPGHNEVIVLVDASGSMRGSDPACLRGAALSLLVALLPDGDRVQVIEFGDSTRELTPGVVALDAAGRGRLGEVAARCSAADRNTDIAGALRLAARRVAAMNEADRQGFKPVVVLLTDGKHNGQEPLAAALGELQSLTTPVLALGLGSGVDLSQLRSVASATKGELLLASAPEELLQRYIEIARTLGRWALALAENTDGRVERSLPSWVTAWRAVYVPDRPGLAAVQVAYGARLGRLAERYQVIEGRGHQVSVTLPGRGDFIVDVLGDLRLEVVSPGSVAWGLPFPVSVRIAPVRGEPFGRPAFLERASVRLDWEGLSGKAIDSFTLYDDGLRGDSKAKDGTFGGLVTAPAAQPPNFRLSLHGGGAPPLVASGAISYPLEPVRIRLPGVSRRLWQTLTGGQIKVRVEAVCDHPVPVQIILGAAEVSVVASSREAAIVPIAAQGRSPWMQSGTLSWRLKRPGEPPREVTFLFPGRSLLISGLVAFAGMLVLSTVFPRRTAAGATIKITVLGPDDDTRTEICSIDRGGRVVIRDESLTAIVEEVGRFSRTAGLWSRAYLFTPSHPAVRFTTTTPKRRGPAYSLNGPSAWVVTKGDATISFNFTPAY